MPTWDLTVFISRAVGRFPKLEFDTMVPSMSKRFWYTQKAPKLIKMVGLKGLRGITKGEHPSMRTPINRAAY